MVQRGVMGTALPCVASHEGAGTVTATGEAVTGFKKGDRVMAGLPRNRCGHCADCLGPAGYRHYCPRIAGHVGVTLDGAFAEYMIADARESSHIPEGVSFEVAAPLACAGCTVYRGVLQTDLKAGETVGIVGAGGGLGHIGIQFAKARGLVVVGVDARDEGLALAREAGADVVVDARGGKDEAVREVQKVTNGAGVDSTIVLSDADDAAALSCAITKMHGTLVQIAQVRPPPPLTPISLLFLLFPTVLTTFGGLNFVLFVVTAPRSQNPLSRPNLPGHPHQRLLDLQPGRS